MALSKTTNKQKKAAVHQASAQKEVKKSVSPERASSVKQNGQFKVSLCDQLSPPIKPSQKLTSALLGAGTSGTSGPAGAVTDPTVRSQSGTESERTGLWVKCTHCGEILQTKVLRENLSVCPECHHHFRIGAWERIKLLTYDSPFAELGAELTSGDPLTFADSKPYPERIQKAKVSTGLNEAVVVGRAEIKSLPLALGVLEFRFMGGSMGTVVGEKLALLMEYALQENLPVVVVSNSGGARMQEGILSLMQMAKTQSLVLALKQAGLPFISVLADPTTGGVAASYAFSGDLIIAEPNALIGFAGPRVIGQTMRQELPPGFQRSEFLLKHGFIDLIASRSDLPELIHRLLSTMTGVGAWIA